MLLTTEIRMKFDCFLKLYFQWCPIKKIIIKKHGVLKYSATTTVSLN